MTEFEAKKIYLKDAEGNYVLPIAYSAKYDMNGDVIDVNALQPDQTYDSTSTRGQSGVAVTEAISALGGGLNVTELASSGTVTLEDNNIYKVTPSGSLSFVLPEGDVPADEWTTPVQVGTTAWSGVTYGNGKFVAVSSGGYITTSEDGVTWTTPVQADINAWYSVTYGNGKFVAVGDSGYTTTSTNGTTWTTRVQVSKSNWYGVTYANGKFVAVGNSGYITTSEDGVTWSTRVQVGSIIWLSVAYGNGKFVAVGGGGSITTSTNGTTWTTPKQVGTSSWYSVTYADGKFVAVGDSGYTTTSTDGITWSTRVQVGSSTWRAITYGNGKFVAVGSSGYITTSEDGTTWTTPKQVGSSSSTWYSVTYGNDKFVAVGNIGYMTRNSSNYILDPTTFHQILVQINLEDTYSIDVGTDIFFGGKTPDLPKAGVYNLVYEYDNNNDYWVCGLLMKEEYAPQVYEFIIDTSNSDSTTAVSYTGANASFTPASMNFTTGKVDYGSWEDAFFQPRPVMVKYDGTVDYELDKDDFTRKADGVTASDVSNTSYDGNCMIAFPQVWMKFVQDDSTHQHVYISNTQVDSSYHCYTHQNKNGVMLDEIFIMAYEPSNVSNKLRSLAGQTILNSLSGETMQTYAKANGSSWDFMDYGEVQMLQMLCVLMFKSLDTQGTIGAGVVSGSSTTYTTTGDTKDKGMFYAVDNTNSSTTPVKVFGIENLWGNRFKWMNGLIIPRLVSTSSNRVVKYKLCDYTTDGSTTTSYNQTGSGYKTLTNGYTSSKSGYINKLTLNSDGLFASPENVSGSSTTYIPDYAYFYGSTSYNYFARFGGGYGYGAYAGLFCVYLRNQLAISDTYAGASLSCKPL